MANRTNLPVDQTDYAELNVPQTPDVEYTDQQVLAKLAGTKGWEQVTDRIKQRIEFYQKYYPAADGPLANKSNAEIALAWKTAANVISELESIINEVESAKNVVQAGQ